ncbi:alpha/beta hydrolase [Herbiconiux moechotypicola]|uniref:Alpha/beta hydrolase n=1 Tax=Herbiconiux moechotypicola TaxID=637393 RepID=A0ABN3E1D4_9MICO|nr:alpha/beta hydrolase [Herbiconiux moechotypicola]MCS5731276.1 alpha/beta hydrolase [Herbiconiux moechotypicola]
MTVASPYAVELARIPVTERVAEVAGATTRIWEYGAAGTDAGSRTAADTVIVVVHGFRGDHHGLEPVIAHLGAAGRRIVAPDLPGFGESGPLPREHDLAGYVGWLDALVPLVKAESPTAQVVLVGHSFGSIVVSAAAAGATGLEPPAADSIVLINPIAAPALSGPRGVLTKLAIGYYRVAAALPERLGFAVLRSALVVRVISVSMAKTHDRELRRWIHDQHDRYFSAFTNRSVVLDAFRASVSHDVSEFGPAIATPTLLVAADRDDITPIEAQHALQAAMPAAELVVLDEVGHLIHYERPCEAAAAIELFLGERPRIADGATEGTTTA